MILVKLVHIWQIINTLYKTSRAQQLFSKISGTMGVVAKVAKIILGRLTANAGLSKFKNCSSKPFKALFKGGENRRPHSISINAEASS